jgi:rubredoxin
MPNIKNAWQIPAIDLNTILVAIRIASYGNDLEIDTQCPHCEAENSFGVNLRGVLDQMTVPDFSKSLNSAGIEIYFKPLSYEQQSAINTAQFEQQRVLSQLPSSDLSEEEKTKMLNDTLEAITKITIQAITYTISAIRTPSALVTEPEFIREFLVNCDHALYAEIRKHAINLRASDDLQPLVIKCPDCGTEFKQPFTMDTASFFGNAS